MPNGSYVLKRLLQILPTLVFILVVTFLIVRLLPGDPASAILGDKATDAEVARLHAQMGLDQPLIVQFGTFALHVLQGDLGTSTALKLPVLRIVMDRLPATLFLTAMACVLALVLAIPLAALAAVRQGRASDTIIQSAFQVGLSMPVFYIGLVLLTVFAAGLRWFPVGGYGDSVLLHLYHLFLPALTLALSLAAVLMRNLRTAMLDAMTADYADFARAKGLPPRLVLFRHVLRNALISTVTLFGLNIGTLLGGAVITETVFAIPGVGRLMIDSIFARDYPTIQGLTLVMAVLVSLAFLLTDLVQASLDPRVSR